MKSRLGALAITLIIGASACGVKSTSTDMNPNVSRLPTCENAC